MPQPLSNLAAILRPRSHRFALESRQLFDGAALVEAAHAADAPDATHAAHTVPAPTPEAARPATPETHDAPRPAVENASSAAAVAPGSAPHAVYVVDRSVVDWQQIAHALPTGSEVILIDAQSDGASQLAAALRGRTGIGALQIVSHGATGQITLGDSVITADNIAAHAAQWQAIGASLSADGDILLYGCDTAGNGNALLARMSALTGADVAASTDATGAASRGGNWTLESSVGRIDAQALNDVEYQGLLAAPTVTSTATRLSVSEISSLNAAGSDQATLAGWNITNGGLGNVSVTVQVDSDADGTPDVAVGGLTVGANGTPAGTLSFTGTAAAASAWLNGLVFKATDVELGNTAAKAVIRVDVTDAATLLTATRSLDVTVTPSNDPSTLSTQVQTAVEGGDTVLTVATLNALDPEVDATTPTQVPSQIVYGVTANPQYGYLTLGTVRLGVGSVFTQQDVIDGNVHYVHTATGVDQNLPDSFGVRANDGATPVDRSASATIALAIAPVNQGPSVGGSGTVYEGQPANAQGNGGAPLSQVGNFIVADSGGDDASSAITVRLTGLPDDGTLYFTGLAVVNGMSVNYTTPHAITAADVTGAGFVIAYSARAGLTYANNGMRDNDGVSVYAYTDGFKVIVSDAGGGTGTPASTTETTIAITVRPVDDDPLLTGPIAPQATIDPAGDPTGPYPGPFTVTLTTAMLDATDVDSNDGRLTFAVVSQTGLDQGYLLLDGVRIPIGGVFTLDDVANHRVQYVQTARAVGPNETDTFDFQVVDNTIGVRWNADGTRVSRVGGVYDNLGDPDRVDDDALHTFTFTVHLADTETGNGDSFFPGAKTPIESSSTYAGTDINGNPRGSLVEDGSVVIRGTAIGTDPYLSYVVDGVPPSQVVYTILGLDGGGTDWNGAIQRQTSPGVWVDLNVYDAFTQADLNAGDIRFKHDGTSEDFQSTVRFSVSAGILVDDNGILRPHVWTPAFTFYVTPVNDAPVVAGASTMVIAEGETAPITGGMLRISDPDDATSEAYLEAVAQGGTANTTLVGGGFNYAYNNDPTGPLQFVIDTLPPGGTLQYSTDGTTWLAASAGTVIDASLLRSDAATTGLRFVSDRSEVRDTSFAVHAVDRWGAASNSATVRIQITNVNDAPQIAVRPDLPDPAGSANHPLTNLEEGAAARITSAMLSAFDPDSSKAQVQYRITSAPAHGSVALSTDGGLTFQLLGVGSSFTQANVDAGLVYYVSNGDEGDGKTPGSNPPSDNFGFSLSDGDKEQPGNQFWIYTLPGNDVATVEAPATADVLGAGAAPVRIEGISVADTDLTDLVLGETDFLRVEVSVVDTTNTIVADASLDFTAADPTSARHLVAGRNGSTLVVQGTRDEVNAVLASLTVAFGVDHDDNTLRLRTTVDDRLYDAGGALAPGANGGASATSNDDGTSIDAINNRASAFTALNVSNFNDAPTLTGATTVDVTEDTPLALSSLGLVIADLDSFERDVTVTVQLFGDATHTTLADATALGRFLLGATTGLSSYGGDGSSTITLTGSIAEVQAALNLVRISSATDVNDGPLYMRTTVADFAHADGAKQAVFDTTVNLLAVNDTPTLSVPSDKVLDSGTSIALPGFVIGDARDLAQGADDYVEVTVSATQTGGGVAGALTVVGSGATVIDSNGTAAIVVKGSFADVQATLNTMVFTPTNANADVRVRISTSVDDRSNGAEGNPAGTGNNTATGSFFINISSDNDMPSIAAPTTLVVNEDSTNNIVSGLVIADPDDFGAIESVTLDLGAGAKGTIALGSAAGLTFTVGNGTATDRMVFTGTKAALNAALATLTFTPTPNTNTVATAQTLTITVNDLGNTGTGGALTDVDTVAIIINPVNDAPVRDGAGAAILSAATEDVAGGPSNTVANLFAGSFDDLLDTVDGGSTANAFAGIAITDNASIAAQGVWQYSTDGTTWTNLPTVAAGNAFLLKPSDSLRFVPAANYFGTPGRLTARLIDGSAAAFTTGTRADVSNDTALSGGTTRYSNSTNVVTLRTTVVNVNDRPTGTNGTLTVGVEDVANASGSTVTTLFGAGYGDVTDNRTAIAGGGNAATPFGGIAIVGNAADASTQGTWEYSINGGTSWTAVPAGASDAAAVLLPTNARVRFVPAGNYNGTPGGLTVRLSDAPVTAGTGDIGATVADQTSHWSVVRALGTTIAPRNDAPVIGGTTGDHPVTENAGVGTGVPDIMLVSAVTLADLDLGTTSGLTVFGAGSITVSLGSTYVVGDELFVSGGLPAGVTVAGGTHGVNLVVTFDANTTVAEVADVVSRLTWHSLSDNPTFFGEAGKGQRTYTVVVNDGNNQQAGGNAGGPASLNSNTLTGTITITPVNDAPVAIDDTRSLAEDTGPITGNVIVGGSPGDMADTDLDNRLADLVVVAVRTGTDAAGIGTPGTVASGLAGSYGTLVLNTDGSYTYTVDNANPVVNALKTGQTLTETYTYTISDGAGGTDVAQLTITINGHTDGAPSIVPVDGNGAATGEATIYESGLTPDGPAGQSRTTTGAITLSALDGLTSVAVGGTTLTLTQLQALSAAMPSAAIDTGEGTLVLDGFTATRTNGIVTGGSLSYTYTLKDAQVQPSTIATTDSVALVVADAANGTSTGMLTVQIVDDVPTAHPDTNTVIEDGPSTASGNVVTDAAAGQDRIGADGAALTGPVTAVSFGGTARTVGVAFASTYGTVTLDADGGYTYTLDNANPAVNALKNGRTLTEVVTYTITDKDGDSSTATLTLTVNGHTDVAGGPAILALDNNGVASGQTDVFEHGLTSSGDASETRGGTIAITAAEGLQTVGVGGITLTLADLAGLSTTTPVVIQTPRGTLTFTGFVGIDLVGGIPTRGNLIYAYTLGGQVAQPGATESTDPIALVVTDAGNASSTGTLVIRIVDDVPVAADDVDSVAEDDAPVATGNVRGNDVLGADDANGVPVTAVSFGSVTGAVGNPLITAYGSIVVKADGSYSYTLDNDNPAVQHLIAGETLTDTVNYTITDADGDTSTARLSITVQGRSDIATLQIVDGNGSDTGQATVSEHGLNDSGDPSETTGGSFVIGTPDGLASVQLGGVMVMPAQLAALGGTPIVIATARGEITLTGFDPATGTVTYSYTLGSRAQHDRGEATEDIAVTVTDRDGDSTSATLTVRIIDDAPTARDDAASLGIALPNATVGGNVFGAGGKGPGDVADRPGADFTPTPVSAFSFDGRVGAVGGAPLAGSYGSLQLRADGSYVYSVNDRLPAVAALSDGQTLTEVFGYTITDADGSSNGAQLVITIRGATLERPPAGDQVFPVDHPSENRRIMQRVQPALFVQHAVRESERISRAASAAIATRAAGGDAIHGGDDIQDETLRIGQDMDNVEHVSRDGVAFSLQMLRDLRQSLVLRGLDHGLPDGANAMFGDFPPFTAPAEESGGTATAKAAPHAERIAVPTTWPHADARVAVEAGDAVAVGARSFSQRLAVAAGERRSVSDLVRVHQQREAARVKVRQVTQ